MSLEKVKITFAWDPETKRMGMFRIEGNGFEDGNSVWVARLILESMGVSIDDLITKTLSEQEKDKLTWLMSTAYPGTIMPYPNGHWTDPDASIDVVMASIPAEHRHYWCEAKEGWGCGCIGCANKAVERAGFSKHNWQAWVNRNQPSDQAEKL
jgi:hypothetical protein